MAERSVPIAPASPRLAHTGFARQQVEALIFEHLLAKADACRRAGAIDLEPWFNAAAQVGRADEAAFLANLDHAHPGARYWGAIGLAGRTNLSPEALRTNPALPVLVNALRRPDLNVVLHAVRARPWS